MKIEEHFIGNNNRIEIISSGGRPTPIPEAWRPVLGSCDILTVIPDMHMYIRNSPLDNFRFGAEAMLSFLNHLTNLKQDLAAQDKTLRIYQIGDIYELRFPSLAHPQLNASAAEVRMSHPDYDQIINTMDHLRTHMLYGNHDFELRHFPSFRFGALEGKVYLEHGFAASPWSENPNKPMWEAAMFVFKELREIESFFLNLAVSVGAIEKDKHYAAGVQHGETERGDYPPENDYPQEQKDYYIGRIKNHSNSPDNRICIIGHTHHPYFNVNVTADGDGYIFVDTGAWTEGRSDFVVLTDEEIALCHYKRLS